MTFSFTNRRRRGVAVAALAVSVLLAGCASARLERAQELVGNPSGPKEFDVARREPLSARAHMWTALALLNRNGATTGDIQLAMSGFQTAARLAPDLWEPLVGLADCRYRLGQHDEALAALAEAIDRRGEIGDLAMPLALVAYRAHRPELARLAYARAGSPTGASGDFLARAFAGTQRWKPAPIAAAPPVKPTPDEERNLLIEAYLIRDARAASLNSGISLLDSLAINFGGSLVNYSYGDTGDASQGNVEVTLTGVSYSMNLATRDVGRISLETSPLVLARLEKPSKFIEGGSVLIVPHGDDSDPIERDIGVSIVVTPTRIGPDDVDLTVELEFSKISAQSQSDAGRGASLLNTEKTRVEVAVRVPYDRAVLVGSMGELVRTTGGKRSIVAIPLPGNASKLASSSVKNVLALISVRRPDGDTRLPTDEADLAMRLFGVTLGGPGGAYGERPSDTPDPDLGAILARLGG